MNSNLFRQFIAERRRITKSKFGTISRFFDNGLALYHRAVIPDACTGASEWQKLP
jgi:hypothetical protein